MKIKNILFAIAFTCLSAGSILGQTTENSQNINSDEEDFMFYEPFSRLYIGVSGAFNFSMPNNSSVSSLSEWTANNGSSIIPSIELSYMLTKNIGIGTGLKLGNYSSGYSVKGFSGELDTEYVDIDGDTYFPIYENVNISEVNTLKSIDIPIFLKYQMGSGKINYFANVGIMFSMYSKMEYTLDGTLTRKGSYPQYNVVLEGYPEYNYGDLSYDPTDVEEIDAPSTGMFGFINLGVLYEVKKDILVRVGVSSSYGLSDINPTISNSFDDFHSFYLITTFQMKEEL